MERPGSAEGSFVWQIAILVGADMAFAMYLSGQVFASKPGRAELVAELKAAVGDVVTLERGMTLARSVAKKLETLTRLLINYMEKGKPLVNPPKAPISVAMSLHPRIPFLAERLNG